MKDEYEDDFSEDLDDEEFEEPDYDDIDWFFLFFIFNNNITIIHNNIMYPRCRIRTSNLTGSAVRFSFLVSKT